MCARSGFKHLIVAAGQFRLVSGNDAITTYSFNTRAARHLFCSVCGVKSFYVPRSNPDGFSVNVNCLDPGTVVGTTERNVDGRNWEAQYARSRVADELASITPLDDVEREHLADARSWVASDAQLYRVEKPATPPKHLVSYFAVVDGDHILLVDHKNARLWLPSGGHVEPDEDPRLTVVRELREELGLDIDQGSVGPPIMVTVTATVGETAGHTDVSLWYAVRCNRDSPVTFDPGEFHSVRWFAFNDVPLQRSDPHLGRFLQKYQARRA